MLLEPLFLYQILSTPWRNPCWNTFYTHISAISKSFLSHLRTLSYPASLNRWRCQNNCMIPPWLLTWLCQLRVTWCACKEYPATPAYTEHFNSSCYLPSDRISILQTLKELHWLPVQWRINFKVVTLTYKVSDSCEPSFLFSESLSSFLVTHYKRHLTLDSCQFFHQKLRMVPEVSAALHHHYGTTSHSTHGQLHHLNLKVI